MKDNILLSICIPTYNRAHYLKQCLDNIVLQFDNETVKNSIEVVVSDHARTDNTTELVKTYQSRFNNIQYFRNHENLGMDENIINSVVKAKGKYCWNIGDDDIIQNGAIEVILAILAKEEIALLTVNIHSFIDIKQASEKKHFKEDDCVEYMKSAEELLLSKYDTGALGVHIFNRKLWLTVDKKQYEKAWACFEFIFKMIGRTSLPLLCLKPPVLFVGQDYRWNEGGTSLYLLTYGRRFMRKLKDYGYSKTFIDSRVDMFAKSLFRTTLSAKTYDFDCSVKNLWLLYKEFYRYPGQLFMTSLVFFIPNYFIKMAKKLKKSSI